MDAFTRGYIECALWSSTDWSTEQGGDPLDRNYGPSNLAPETLARMVADCASFQQKCGEAGLSAFGSQEGHDFWLTRNRHGAGFWDGDYPEPDATKLTDLSHSFGECDLYIGDDGKIHAA